MSISDFPSTFVIETVNGCNLRCVECYCGNGSITRKKGMLKYEQYAQIAGKIRPYCRKLYLHLYGEPLLNPDIFQMIKDASQWSFVNISTNGVGVTREKAEQLVLAGVKEVIVSIDGMTQETYEKYRANGNVKQALNTLANIQYFNQKYHAGICMLPQFIPFKHNQHEMRAFADYCHSLGLKPLFKPAYLSNAHSGLRLSDLPQYWREMLPDEKSLNEYLARTCQADTFNICLDGSVTACCHDYDCKLNFGNIYTQSVEEIWQSERYRNFRETLRQGILPGFCQKHCLSAYTLKQLASREKTLDSSPRYVVPSEERDDFCPVCGSSIVKLMDNVSYPETLRKFGIAANAEPVFSGLMGNRFGNADEVLFPVYGCGNCRLRFLASRPQGFLETVETSPLFSALRKGWEYHLPDGNERDNWILSNSPEFLLTCGEKLVKTVLSAWQQIWKQQGNAPHGNFLDATGSGIVANSVKTMQPGLSAYTVSDLPGADLVFDYVALGDTLLRAWDVQDTMRNIIAHTRSGGIVIVVVPDAESEEATFASLGHPLYAFPHISQAFAPKTLQCLGQINKLNVVAQTEYDGLLIFVFQKPDQE